MFITLSLVLALNVEQRKCSTKKCFNDLLFSTLMNVMQTLKKDELHKTS